MPRPAKGKRLGGSPSHQKAMLSNLSASLFWDEKITTTVSKAKAMRPYAEKLITKAKSGSLHDRRQVLRHITDNDVVTKLFDDWYSSAAGSRLTTHVSRVTVSWWKRVVRQSRSRPAVADTAAFDLCQSDHTLDLP